MDSFFSWHNLFANSRQRINSAPQYLVFLWFGGVIVIGTLLLWLPLTHLNGQVEVSLTTALFTAVSAACVTGLSVINVAETYSFTGQLVIFVLMEVSGLGIATFATVGFRLIGRRLTLTQQAAAAEALYQGDAAQEFKHTFREIFRVTLIVQAAGFLVMLVALAPRHLGEGIEEQLFLVWSAAFHSVSAFTSCGFTIYPDAFDSLKENYLFLSTLLVLIVLGGIGHMVLNELYHLPGLLRRRVRKPHLLSLHAKVVLLMTAILTLGGIVCIWFFGTSSKGATLWEAAFQTINARTSGFNIELQADMPLPTALIVMLLMFIGGSPGSCAGGVKTTSVAIWFARIKANLRNDTDVNLFGYTIAPEIVSRARILMALAMLWNSIGIFLLASLHPGEKLQTLMVEQLSAFGTIGLSMEFTPRLTDLTRVWLCLSMFIGRLGPLSMALWILPVTRARIGHPVGRIMVG